MVSVDWKLDGNSCCSLRDSTRVRGCLLSVEETSAVSEAEREGSLEDPDMSFVEDMVVDRAYPL